MAKENKYSLSPYQVALINAVLSDGKRVELIPAKDGIEIKSIRREAVK